MAHFGGSQPGLRANRRLLVGGGLGLAGVAGMTAVSGPAGIARAAAAQDGTPSPVTAVPGTLKTVGNGSVPLPPDAASVVVGVEITAESLSDAQAEATSTMEAILAAIAARGIADEDVQTASYNVSPVQDYDPQTGMPKGVTGFQVSNMVNVKVSNVDELGTLLDDVVGAGANAIYGVTFFNNDPDAAATQARGLAVDDAKAKAQELADAAGLTLGRILAISEGFASVGPIYDAKGGGRAGGETPIAPGTNAITASVEVLFELGS